MTPIELAVARANAAAELAKIDAEIAARNQAQRADRIAQVRTMMSECGLTMADIGQVRAVASIGTAARARAPVAPQYRNSAGQTWAGRGKRPTWLRTALESGSKLDEFKIAA